MGALNKSELMIVASCAKPPVDRRTSAAWAPPAFWRSYSDRMESGKTIQFCLKLEYVALLWGAATLRELRLFETTGREVSRTAQIGSKMGHTKARPKTF